MANKDRVAVRLTRVIDVCVLLYQSLKEFEEIVLKENEAIGRSDLQELESITDQKIHFGDQTSRQIQVLQEAMDLLAMEVGEIPRRSWDERQLAQSVKLIQDRVLSLYPDFDLLVARLGAWSLTLKNLRYKVFAQIETNAYLVQKLLDYHRETYAFWQAVALDSESGYGKTGKTKYGQSGPSKSLLTVRT